MSAIVFFAMLRIVLAVLSVSAVVNIAVAQIDYCKASLCKSGTHIGCNNNGAWAAACPTSPAPRQVDLNLALRKHVVRMHNVRRNKLALGKLANYEPARRMATIRWSPEMAKLAALNVLQCEMKHDACRNTNKFKASGQNLALIEYDASGPARTVQQLLTTSINLWWSEHKNANMNVIRSYPASWTGKAIGHFTVMARQPNWAVGCAAAIFKVGTRNKFLLACNYATTNWIGQAIYAPGKTAAGCTTGTNVNYAGLCKVAEVYNL